MQYQKKYGALLVGLSIGMGVLQPMTVLAAQGWVQEQGHWLYYGKDNQPVKSQMMKINGRTYCFDKNGYMVTGWFGLDDGSKYFFDHSGAMKTKWLHLNDQWYFFADNGRLVSNSWKEDKGKWYLLANDGVMYTGWYEDNDTWYYLDKSGAAKTGRLNSFGQWYYFTSEVKMEMNAWIYDPNEKVYYYLDGRGVWIDTSAVSPATYQKPEKGLSTNEDIAYIQNQPIQFLHYGWIVQVGNKFGLIQPDGTWMYPPEYESVNLIYVGEGYASGPIGYVANFYKEKGSFEGGFSLSNKGVGELVGGLGGATGLKPVVIDGKVQIYDYASQKWTTDYSLFAEKNVNYIIYDVKESEVEGGKNYYI